MYRADVHGIVERNHAVLPGNVLVKRVVLKLVAGREESSMVTLTLGLTLPLPNMGIKNFFLLFLCDLTFFTLIFLTKNTQKKFPQSRRLEQEPEESSSEEQPYQPPPKPKRVPVKPPKIINKIPIDEDMCGSRNLEAEYTFMKTFGDEKKSKKSIVKILCSDYCQNDKTDANECQDARTAVGEEFFFFCVL